MANPIKIIDRFIDSQRRLGDFIQNGPSEGVGGWVRDRYRNRCDQFSNVPPWVLALSPIGRQSISNWCTPYWEDQGTSPPENETPFGGGQCEGSRYTLTGTFVVSCGFNEGQTRAWRSGGGLAIGPITGIVQTADGWEVGHAGSANIGVVDDLANTGVLRVPRPGVACSQVANQNATADQTPTITSITPFGGDPNDCGDPEPQLEPGPNPAPDPGPLPGPEPTDDPDGGPFPSFPIPDWPGPLADYPIEEPPEDGGNGGGGDGLPGDPEAIGGEAGEVTGGEDGEDIDFGEPPEGRVWIGCIVETSSIGALGNIAGTGPQSTVWPTVRANAALNYGSKKGTSQRINSKFHDLIRSATSLIVTGVFLQVQPGSTSKVFPLSALTCPENPCED